MRWRTRAPLLDATHARVRANRLPSHATPSRNCRRWSRSTRTDRCMSAPPILIQRPTEAAARPLPLQRQPHRATTVVANTRRRHAGVVNANASTGSRRCRWCPTSQCSLSTRCRLFTCLIRSSTTSSDRRLRARFPGSSTSTRQRAYPLDQCS